jgi:NAD(P)-dependent dehydrogenase (short-subunit alcohol dehydrogenase family)
VAAGIDLTGRRAVVTGASSGLGVETARALAATGAEVTLAVRDTTAGESAAKDITATTGSTAVHVAPLDLTDPESVAAFTASWDGPLHILVNNAGVMACPEQFTPLGWEWQFATNHLGHFALATGLHTALAADGAARIVVASSTGHQTSPVVFDHVNFAFRPYGPWLAYGQSKTANVLFAVEATHRWARDGITANALMPGAIYTNLQRHTGGRGRSQMMRSWPRPRCAEQPVRSPTGLPCSSKQIHGAAMRHAVPGSVSSSQRCPIDSGGACAKFGSSSSSIASRCCLSAGSSSVTHSCATPEA